MSCIPPRLSGIEARRWTMIAAESTLLDSRRAASPRGVQLGQVDVSACVSVGRLLVHRRSPIAYVEAGPRAEPMYIIRPLSSSAFNTPALEPSFSAMLKRKASRFPRLQP
jgi:hypothetical protein